jgi:hypothetical protein
MELAVATTGATNLVFLVQSKDGFVGREHDVT